MITTTPPQIDFSESAIGNDYPPPPPLKQHYTFNISFRKIDEIYSSKCDAKLGGGGGGGRDPNTWYKCSHLCRVRQFSRFALRLQREREKKKCFI